MGLLVEIDKVIVKGREGVKVTSNGIAYFVEYPISTESLASQIISKMLEEVDSAGLTDEEIEKAEIKGAKEYKQLVTDLKIPYSRDGLVLWIQKSIANVQLQAIKKAIKGEK